MKFSDIKHNPDRQQFTLEVDGNEAKIDYTKRDGKLYLVHSEVPYEFRGRGVGKVLVEKTFEYIEEKNLEAVAVCSYIKAVAQRSPKWKSIIG